MTKTQEPSICVGKAWLVTVFGIPSVVFSDRSARAKWKVVAALRNAGYVKRGEWPTGMAVERASELDDAPLDYRKVFTLEHVRSVMRPVREPAQETQP